MNPPLYMAKRSGFISQIPASQELAGFSLCFMPARRCIGTCEIGSAYSPVRSPFEKGWITVGRMI
jgi:hypothetical protein